MKILIITPLYPGYKNQSNKEITYAIHYFSKLWHMCGHEVRVLRIWPYTLGSLRNKKSRSYLKNEKFEMDGVWINRIPMLKLPRMNYLKKEIKTIYKNTVDELSKKFKPDIIINHTFNPALYISKPLKQKFDVPLLMLLHKTDIKGLKKRRNYYRKFLKYDGSIDKIGFRTRKIMNEYYSIPKIKQQSLDDQFILSSGIEKDDLINTQSLESKISKPISTVFIASNMDKGKNVDTLIKAFNEIPKEYDLILKIAGDGIERRNLEKLVKKLNIKDYVQFLGHLSRSETLKHMEDSDIFAMVSAPETFGLVYIEAMGKGCITIGSKGEGIDGTIIDGVNGFLSYPRDVKMLTETFKTVLNLSAKEQTIIINKAVKTAEMQTQEKLAEYYLTVMEKTISDYNHTY